MQSREAQQDASLRQIPQDTLRRWQSQLQGDLTQLRADQSYKPTPADAQLSQPPGEDFELGEQVGCGGMGDVFRARQPQLERLVAFKRLKAEHRGHEKLREAFVAEAVVTGRLEHPNIVPVYALGEDEGSPFMAMKLVEGRTWKELLAEASQTDPTPQLEILLQLCNAVAFAHSRGIVHNDLKPANVMLGEFGEVILLDWGMAVDFRDAPDPDSRVRHRSSLDGPCGTPSYIAPELAMGQGALLGPWTDVYLLGGILYEILSGHPPHRGGSVSLALQSALQGSPAELPDSVPPPLIEICRNSLARLPCNRYADVGEFQEALRSYLRNQQSLHLSQRAEEKLEACRQAGRASSSEQDRLRLYADYAACVAGFAEARAVWQGNRDAARGEEEARLAFAEHALQHGDLGLAQVHLGELQGSARAGALRVRVDAASERRRGSRRAARRLRRMLQLAALLIVVALLGISAILLLWKNQSERQQARSEALASSMLFKLYPPLNRLGRLDLLVGVAQSLDDYYQDFSLEAASDEELVNFSELRLHLADIYAMQAQPQEALAHYYQALEPLEQLLSRQPGNIDAHQAASTIQTRIGQRCRSFGMQEEALQALARAETAAERARQLGGAFQTMSIAYEQARVLTDMGRTDEAFSVYLDAWEAFRARPEANEADLDANQAELYQVLAAAFAASAEWEQAFAAWSSAQQTCQRILQADPQNYRVHERLCENFDRVAAQQLLLGRLEQAQTTLEEGLAEKWRLNARHPELPAAQRALFSSYNLMGRLYEARGELEAAREVFAKSVDVARELVAADGSHAQWQRDLSVGCDDAARVHRALGDQAAALASSIEALAISEQAHALDPSNDPNLHGLPWSRFFWVGFSAALQEDYALAVATFERGRQTFPGLFYLHLWRVALGGAPELLREVSVPEGSWQQDLKLFFLGEISADQLLARAQAADNASERAQLSCEAHAYIGLSLEQQEPERARQHYRLCLETLVSEFYEYQWAQARLRKKIPTDP